MLLVPDDWKERNRIDVALLAGCWQLKQLAQPLFWTPAVKRPLSCKLP
jgi:hypothetical protein